MSIEFHILFSSLLLFGVPLESPYVLFRFSSFSLAILFYWVCIMIVLPDLPLSCCWSCFSLTSHQDLFLITGKIQMAQKKGFVPYRFALSGPCRCTWRKPLCTPNILFTVDAQNPPLIYLSSSILGDQEIQHLVGDPCCHFPRYVFRFLNAKLLPGEVTFLSLLILGPELFSCPLVPHVP